MFFHGFQRKVLRKLDEILGLLRARSLVVNSFVIIGEEMNINPGQATVLTAVPLAAPVPPATVGLPTTLPVGDVPQWGVSDPSKITAVPSADGLSLSVTVNPSAAPGDIVFTITDGLNSAAQGSFTLTIPGQAVNAVAIFDVTASTPSTPTGVTLTQNQMSTKLSIASQPGLTSSQINVLFPVGGPASLSVAVASAMLINANQPLTSGQISALNT